MTGYEVDELVDRNRAKLIAEGYTQVNENADRRVQALRRLLRLKRKRFGGEDSPIVFSAPASQLSWDVKQNKRVAVSGLWTPTWMITLAEHALFWRDEALVGQAVASDHDDIVEVLYKGLEGDMEAVWSYIGLQELAREAATYNRP